MHKYQLYRQSGERAKQYREFPAELSRFTRDHNAVVSSCLYNRVRHTKIHRITNMAGKLAAAALMIVLLGLSSVADKALASDTALNKEQAIRITEKNVGGKALSARLGKNKKTYRVRVLMKDGRVKTVSIDKDSGRILKK